MDKCGVYVCLRLMDFCVCGLILGEWQWVGGTRKMHIV